MNEISFIICPIILLLDYYNSGLPDCLKTNNRESAGGYLHISLPVTFEKESHIAPVIPVEFTQKSFHPFNP